MIGIITKLEILECITKLIKNECMQLGRKCFIDILNDLIEKCEQAQEKNGTPENYAMMVTNHESIRQHLLRGLRHTTILIGEENTVRQNFEIQMIWNIANEMKEILEEKNKNKTEERNMEMNGYVEDFALIAKFGFAKEPMITGERRHVGDTIEYTLDGKAEPYRCDKNELLVISNVTLVSDDLGLIKKAYPTTCGRAEETQVVEPGDLLNIVVEAKTRSELHIAPDKIKNDIKVVIAGRRYRIG